MNVRFRFFPATAASLGLAVLALSHCGDDGGSAGGPVSGGSGGNAGESSTSSGGQTSGGSPSSGGAGGDGGAGGAAAGFSSLGDSSFETQTTIASDGSGGIVVVWVAVFTEGPSAVGYSISRDGGASFTAPAYLAAPEQRLSTNPVLTVDSQGVFTLAWLGFRLDFAEPDEHIYVARLDAQADTFGSPVVASDDGTSTTLDFDKPYINVDANDEVLLTWADFSGTPTLTFARSDDGLDFTRSEIVSDLTFGNLASLCLDRSLGGSAPLYVVHLGPDGTLSLRKSTTQGQSWELLAAPPAASVVFQEPNCVVDGNTLTIAYASGAGQFSTTDDTPADAIYVAVSEDAGVSFSQPKAVTLANEGQYLFPRIAISPDGRLEIAYYQGVVDADATFMHASSSDQGASWTRAPIAPAGTLTTDLALASWLGAYVGLTVPGTSGFVSFTENSAGKTHIAFAEIALP
jgi:hypothetical protein